MAIYKIFTVSEGAVEKGAEVTKYVAGNPPITIPAIVVGEEGRGRKLGVLPVRLSEYRKKIFDEKGHIIIYQGRIESDGKKQFLVAHEPIEAETEKAIVVFYTPIGFRGGNSHTGDRIGGDYEEFPGDIVVHGIIAQGTAGRMGHGYQMVAIVPKNTVFRTGYSGRLYGRSPAHYYVFTGDTVISVSSENRPLLEAIGGFPPAPKQEE